MDRRYVGIDLHRRRSVIYAMGAAGDRLFCERIVNDPWRLLEVVSAAGETAEVVIEATYGWYWAVDVRGCCRERATCSDRPVSDSSTSSNSRMRTRD
jgi:hypothetical protein